MVVQYFNVCANHNESNLLGKKAAFIYFTSPRLDDNIFSLIELFNTLDLEFTPEQL